MPTTAIRDLPNYVRVFVKSADNASTTADKIEAVQGALAHGLSLRQIENENREAFYAHARTGAPGKSSLANYNAVGVAFDEAGIDLHVENDKRAQAAYTASTAPANDKDLVWAALKAGKTAVQILDAHRAGEFKKEKVSQSIATVIANLLKTAAEKDLTAAERATIAQAIATYTATAPKVEVPEVAAVLVNA